MIISERITLLIISLLYLSVHIKCIIIVFRNQLTHIRLSFFSLAFHPHTLQFSYALKNIQQIYQLHSVTQSILFFRISVFLILYHTYAGVGVWTPKLNARKRKRNAPKSLCWCGFSHITTSVHWSLYYRPIIMYYHYFIRHYLKPYILLRERYLHAFFVFYLT
jgi:hypothetical protein